MVTIVTVLIFLGAFAVIYRDMAPEYAVALVAATAIFAVGTASGGFTPRMALESVYFETLALIFGMSAVSALLARSGVFAYLAAETAEHSKGNGWWVLVMMSLVAYGMSLFTNSLVTMAVILPITLAIARQVTLNPVPLIVSEIVASNLGGASTMIGDFPNMIIASAGGLHFNDFIGGMMAPCLVLMAVSLVFFEGKLRDWRSRPQMLSSAMADDAEIGHHKIDSVLLRSGLIILAIALLAFLFGSSYNLRPGWVAFVAGVIALAIGRFDEKEIFAACGGKDILFFIGLFVMVGGLTAAGVLDWMVWAIEFISGDGPILKTLALMWVAAGITLFVGGSTATAFFVPVAASLQGGVDHQASWWALSLGVLAGSTGTLSGATPGSLALSHFDQFLKRHPEIGAFIPEGRGLSYREYWRWGAPLMMIFLGFSTFYIIAIAG